MPVAVLEQSMPAQELTEWQAYLGLKAEVDAIVADGGDRVNAYQMVFTPRDEEPE